MGLPGMLHVGTFKDVSNGPATSPTAMWTLISWSIGGIGRTARIAVPHHSAAMTISSRRSLNASPHPRAEVRTSQVHLPQPPIVRQPNQLIPTPDIYRIIAEACANAGRYLTQSPYATVSIDPDAAFPTAGLSSLAAGLASKISSHIADATVTPGLDAPWDGWGHLGRWGGGWGPFGGGWGPLPTDGPWTTGAWTAWWNGTACPHPTWSGWTAGEWRTRADWTSWRGCVATTTTTRVMTVTDAAGGTATSTSYGVKVQEANTEGASWGTPTPTSTSTGGPAAGRERAMGALVAVALGAVMLL